MWGEDKREDGGLEWNFSLFLSQVSLSHSWPFREGSEISSKGLQRKITTDWQVWILPKLEWVMGDCGKKKKKKSGIFLTHSGDVLTSLNQRSSNPRMDKNYIGFYVKCKSQGPSQKKFIREAWDEAPKFALCRGPPDQSIGWSTRSYLDCPDNIQG